MQGYFGNIEQEAKENSFFRKVLYTDTRSQLVVMSLLPGEEIGSEIHPHLDQFIRFEDGEGKVVLHGEERAVSDGYAVIVPAGVEHNVINTSATLPLKLYTIYIPPEHKAGTIHRTKEDAEADEHHH